jgi:hypothetical protein
MPDKNFDSKDNEQLMNTNELQWTKMTRFERGRHGQKALSKRQIGGS